MFWSADDRPVVVVVSEVPVGVGCDGCGAPPAGGPAGLDYGCEGGSGAVVCLVVPACLPGPACLVPFPGVVGAAAGAVRDGNWASGLGAGVFGAGHVLLPSLAPAGPHRLRCRCGGGP